MHSLEVQVKKSETPRFARAPFYLIRRLPNGHVDLHRSEIGFVPRTVPPVFDDAGQCTCRYDFSTYVGMGVIAEYILCDFLCEEAESDRKAKALAPFVGRRLGKLGSTRADLKINGNFSWTVSESEIADMVASALCTAASAAGTHDCVLESQGQRRDLLRAAAQAESTPRLLELREGRGPYERH